MNSVLELAEVRSLAASGEARRIRKDNRLALQDIATAVGVGAPCIHRWETGVRSPRGDAAIRYLGILNALRRARV